LDVLIYDALFPTSNHNTIPRVITAGLAASPVGLKFVAEKVFPPIIIPIKIFYLPNLPLVA
jgi:hypothetical protein